LGVIFSHPSHLIAAPSDDHSDLNSLFSFDNNSVENTTYHNPHSSPLFLFLFFITLTMDSDWCLFCEKHVMDLGAAYCSKECSKMDKLMSLANKPSSTVLSSPSISASALTPASASSMKRFAHSPMTVTYPSMFKSSTLVPSSMSSRGGISKSAYTPIPAATTSIRCLPASRSAVRRQPLVLFD